MRIILTLLFIANVVTFADVTIREFWQIIVPEEFFNDDIRYEQSFS